MADPGIREDLADQRTPWAMADQGAWAAMARLPPSLNSSPLTQSANPGIHERPSAGLSQRRPVSLGEPRMAA